MDMNEECWDHVPSLLMNTQDSTAHSSHYLCNPQELLVGGQTAAGTPGSSGTSPPLVSPGSSAGAGGGAISPGGGGSSAPHGSSATAGGGSSCCENGRPIMTDPVSGQTVCSCQYDSARLALSAASYTRLPASGVGVYGSPYSSTDQNPYPSIGVDSSAFYSPLSNPYGLKDSGSSADMSAWTSASLQTTTGYYPYDPTLAAYGYGAGYDLAARRKNATRESTATLKAWLNEHKKNPYPTKGEKIMLAIITKMTLTQVSTWFANARRRLKKENKMTWEPKNKTDDDDDALVSDSDEKDKDDLSYEDGDRGKDRLRDEKDGLHVKMESRHDKDMDDEDDMDDDEHKAGDMMAHHLHSHHPLHHTMHHQHMLGLKDEMKTDCGIPVPATKPKIWSLADTAACKTPPPQSQPWQTCNTGFALPPSTQTTNNPYARYSGFLNPYNTSNNHSGNYTNSAGFPEVQTDTPPQTPPNMKLPNLVNGQQTQGPPGGQIGPIPPPATNGGYPAQQGYNQFSNRPPSQLSPRRDQQDFQGQPPSRRGGQSQQHLHPMNPNEGTAFKPFFKGSPPMSNGFVSPV